MEDSSSFTKASYMGHTWFRWGSSNHGPARFWEYTLFTEAEYGSMSESERKACTRLTEWHVNHIKRYNPRLGHK